MVFRVCKSDKDGTEDGEHVRLNESDKQLKAVHEYHQQEADATERTNRSAHLSADEDNASERQDDGMAAHDIGKQTDHQGEGLREDAEKFYHRHHRYWHFQPCGHFGPEDFLPILSVAEQVDGQEGAEGQEECDGNITCDVGSTREDGQQSQEVAQEYKEEARH